MLVSAVLLVAAQVGADVQRSNRIKVAKPDKIVCRMEYEVGSKIPNRICRTAAQWELVQLETERDAREALKNRACIGSGCNPAGN